MNMTQMYKLAIANREETGEKYGHSRVILANGGTLICAIEPRQSNSRGARRSGGYDATTWLYVEPGAEFSKQCSAQTAKELLEQHGAA